MFVSKLDLLFIKIKLNDQCYNNRCKYYKYEQLCSMSKKENKQLCFLLYLNSTYERAMFILLLLKKN